MLYCVNCGKEISAENEICPFCGTPINKNVSDDHGNAHLNQSKSHRHIDNHLTKAILATLFCCLPFGIAAIVNAASVNGKIQAGDFTGAQIASEKADSWANWSIGIGLVAGVIYFIAALAGGM